MKEITVCFDDLEIIEILLDGETLGNIPDEVIKVGESFSLCMGISEFIDDDEEYEEELKNQGLKDTSKNDLLEVIKNHFKINGECSISFRF